MMVDKDLVRGMMLRRRELGACDACHIGKQKQRAHRKKLNRNIMKPNQVVYADLLIPSKDNGTKYEAVLVIMDGYSRFVTIHLLKSKSSTVVNQHMKEYVLWAERQAGRHKIEQVLTRTVNLKYRVHQVQTDKGGEFVNTDIDAWYKAHGIEHILVGPKSSQLNLCERTHQSLVEMTKATMHDAGFPRSLWPDALRNAVYIKNRTYNKGTQGIPYEMMFAVKPDLHHIRKFGALAYVHVPVTPGRKKHHDNARLGFVLGYAEDVVGCKVYFPENRTATFVSDLRVAEDVMYRDRHGVSLEDDDLESLHFTRAAETPTPSDDESTLDEPTMTSANDDDTVAATVVNETMASITMDLEGGEACAAPSAVPTRTAQRHVELSEMRATTCKASTADLGGITAALPSVETRAHTPADVSSAQTEAQQVSTGHQSEELAGTDVQHENLGLPIGSEASMEMKTDQSLQPVLQSEDGNETGCSASELCDGSESVVSVCGTAADDAELIAEDEEPANEDDDETVVASVCGKIMGKRRRDETPSEEIRVELSAAKQEPKRKRTGLREYHERKKPAYFEDYVMNVAQRTTRILGKNGRPIRGSDVRIPKNRRAALRSKYCNLFCEAELEEMAALKARHVLEEIMYEDVPEGAKPIKTKWVYDTKTDSQGYVIRFKARLVALGNYQRPGIDFHDTFSPVARMSSFRLMVGLAAELDLKLFGGDINTAYLNADLGIKQYVSSIEGFPCEIDGHIYVVKKALYGLRQSGREWNSELNQWMLDHGYQRSMTEPCLYFRLEGDMTMLVLVYVDDILVATNAEEEKNKLFEDLDKEYGIKDQGLLKHHLGVEVEQTDECVIIRQRKYAHEIVEKFGYGEAHPVGNPMEVNARFEPLGENEDSDTSFPYREAIGMLMYLATSTRPDLAFALSQLCRFVAKPSHKHVGALKRVLRYFAGTENYGITYTRQAAELKSVVLEGYCDSDWGNDPETRKSTTGLVFTLAGGAVSWMSRRQTIVALSTAEAEYVAACEAAMEAVSESNILQEILPQQDVKLRIGMDSQAALVMATNPTYSRRTRHIELRWHCVREQVEKGVIDLHKVCGDVNPADMFTKPLDKLRLKRMLALAGIGGVD
uniref:Integrase catalytic domain-containing protein n=1 Tax=Phytophthora fragariae TaxID=53985 RepID=A0A6A3EVX2_9STRA|nr:hypothetical protein PF009_g15856 [Phytophthora fragariae]